MRATLIGFPCCIYSVWPCDHAGRCSGRRGADTHRQTDRQTGRRATDRRSDPARPTGWAARIGPDEMQTAARFVAPRIDDVCTDPLGRIRPAKENATREEEENAGRRGGGARKRGDKGRKGIKIKKEKKSGRRCRSRDASDLQTKYAAQCLE